MALASRCTNCTPLRQWSEEEVRLNRRLPTPVPVPERPAPRHQEGGEDDDDDENLFPEDDEEEENEFEGSVSQSVELVEPPPHQVYGHRTRIRGLENIVNVANTDTYRRAAPAPAPAQLLPVQRQPQPPERLARRRPVHRPFRPCRPPNYLYDVELNVFRFMAPWEIKVRIAEFERFRSMNAGTVTCPSARPLAPHPFLPLRARLISSRRRGRLL
ncbi:MAG: hypothetical protein MHM6MM_002527 [Cercozoa sp. M6MM]